MAIQQKKRGRPAKVVQEVAAPKKRGRPARVVEEVAAPKKRGRPAKVVHEKVVKSTKVVATQKPVTRKAAPVVVEKQAPQVGGQVFIKMTKQTVAGERPTKTAYFGAD